MWAPGVPAWHDVTVVDPRTMSKPRFVGRVVRAGPRFDAAVISGASRFHDLYRDLVAGILLGLRRRPPAIVVAETAWDLGSAPLSKLIGFEGLALPSVALLGVRALDGDHVTYCVFSQEEGDLFSSAFGIPPERIEVLRFGHSLWSRADGPVSDDGYVFAGGDSLRDYGTLLAAAEGLDVPVRIATNHDLGSLPPNVSAGPVPYEEYVELLAGASAVVVPMRKGRRAAGLLTYLNAMVLRKPTIITDSPAVGEYVEPGRTALVVPPEDPAALRGAIAWVLDPANRSAVEAMGEAARASVRHPNDYWQSLRDVAERAAARVSARS
jgi:hypothetical protein